MYTVADSRRHLSGNSEIKWTRQGTVWVGMITDRAQYELKCVEVPQTPEQDNHRCRLVQ